MVFYFKREYFIFFWDFLVTRGKGYKLIIHIKSSELKSKLLQRRLSQ